MLACVLVATIGGSPWAADDKPAESPAIQKFSKLQATRAIDSLLEQHGTSLRAAADPESDLEELLGGTEKTVKLKPFIYAMAVDGDDLVYARTARTMTNRQIQESLGGFPTIVMRKNLRTGIEAVLFQSNSTAVGTMHVKGGAVSLGTSKLSTGRRSLVFDTSVLHAAPGSTEMKVVVTHSGRVSIGRDTVKICGTIASLAGATDVGNPLVNTLTGKCDELGFLTTETREIQGLDASKKVALPAEQFVLMSGPVDIVGDLATIFSPNDLAFGIGNIQSGEFTSLWTNVPPTSALASDGTVALMDSEEEGFEDFSHEKSLTESMFVFPQGDANNPVEVKSPISDSTRLKFCGPNLYVVKQAKQTAKQRRASRQGRVDGMLGPSQADLANHNVTVHDRSGALVKDLGKTPSMRIGVLGCSGDAIVMIAVRGLKTTELRYQP